MDSIYNTFLGRYWRCQRDSVVMNHTEHLSETSCKMFGSVRIWNHSTSFSGMAGDEPIIYIDIAF